MENHFTIRGKDYLKGEKQLEELTGSRYLQSFIITKLVYFLMSNLSEKYQVLTNEVGLQFKDKGWRAADIAILETEKLKGIEKNNKYLNVPPKVVIEIDTKAELEDIKDSLGYFYKKTDELLTFGVERVIWIFTDSEKIMIAEKLENWQLLSWSKEIELIEGIKVELASLIDLE